MQTSPQPAWTPAETPLKWLIACVLSWTTPALHSATLHYEAYLGNVPIGEATVVIERGTDAYQVSGSASVSGVANLLSDWHSRFHASGRVVDGAPYLETYGYDEQDGSKHRSLELRDGMVTTTKNGKPRARFPALDGVDVLTAFFVAPDCWDRQLLHTGRFNYNVVGTPSEAPEQCRFLVRDKDGDEHQIVVAFSRTHGMVLPQALYTFGLLRGRVVLRSVDPDPERSSYASSAHLLEHGR